MNYIIEICVAIDIAIIGIAYPILIDKISNIGEKYSSQFLSELFDNEFPQKKINFNFYNRQFTFSIFKLTLYLTISSFIFLIFNLDPVFNWNNWFIKHSARLFVLISTSFLTVCFFIWLDKVGLYSGKATSLLKTIILKYQNLAIDSEFKTYHLKTINEFTFYAIDKQDEHLQETLLQFYSREFLRIRKNHDKSKPLVYPIDYYFLVNKLNIELINNQNRKLLAVEHRAVSGVWLLGEDFEHILISEETYNWLWGNLYIICENEKFIRMYWANVSQYFRDHLEHVRQDFDYKLNEVKNKKQIEKRNEEIADFREFHFALGGLLLYRKQYKSLKYIFEFSQSQPPNYPLLPHSMTEIFTWVEHFRNEFKLKGQPIEMKYYFPELDNLGNQTQIRFWICSYFCLLFIRQYTLHQYYVYENHTALPQLPEGVIELNNWLDSTNWFEWCLNKVLKNKKMLQDLQLNEVVKGHSVDFNSFIKELRESIIVKIGQQKLNTNLSIEKIKTFEESTNTIISQAFKSYAQIVNSDLEKKKDTDLEIAIKGSVTLMPKSAFTDSDIPNLNFDTVVAEQVARNHIKRRFSESFLLATTRRYLLNKENLLLAIEKLTAERDALIVCFSGGYQIKELLNNSIFNRIVLYIESIEAQFQDFLFVFNRIDLPFIEHRDINAEQKEKLQLKPIDEQMKLYTSIIDINLPENKAIKDTWFQKNIPESEDLKVQVAISFTTILYWNKKRDIVQINLTSQFKEQGIENSINEITPLRLPKEKK